MKKQIAKCIKEISSGAYSPQVVFFDWMQCLALSISNTCTLIHNDLWKKREEQYLSTIRKYDKEARYKMSDMVRMLTATYEDTGLSDVLGEVYMESVGGNKNTGQFFTPYHVSLACAELAVPKNINDDRILLHEPSCGSGGMVVATAQVLQKRGINYQKTLDVVCQDLDWSAVYMCYVQLSLLGIKAIVAQGDTLAEQYKKRLSKRTGVLHACEKRAFDINEDINEKEK